MSSRDCQPRRRLGSRHWLAFGISAATLFAAPAASVRAAESQAALRLRGVIQPTVFAAVQSPSADAETASPFHSATAIVFAGQSNFDSSVTLLLRASGALAAPNSGRVTVDGVSVRFADGVARIDRRSGSPGTRTVRVDHDSDRPTEGSLVLTVRTE